jgi:hypothetical protein
MRREMRTAGSSSSRPFYLISSLDAREKNGRIISEPTVLRSFHPFAITTSRIAPYWAAYAAVNCDWSVLSPADRLSAPVVTL